MLLMLMVFLKVLTVCVGYTLWCGSYQFNSSLESNKSLFQYSQTTISGAHCCFKCWWSPLCFLVLESVYWTGVSVDLSLPFLSEVCDKTWQQFFPWANRRNLQPQWSQHTSLFQPLLISLDRTGEVLALQRFNIRRPVNPVLQHYR